MATIGEMGYAHGMTHRIKARSLAHALLVIAALGGITLLAITAPNAFQMLGRRHRRGEWWAEHEAERRRIREALGRLRRRRMVEFDVHGGEEFLKVTEQGRRYLRKFDFEELKLLKPRRWDGKWRIIVFDVPEKVAEKRKLFQRKLREVGFHQLQKSVWVYPYECRDEADFMASFAEVDPYVLYFESDSLGYGEGRVRRVFGLL